MVLRCHGLNCPSTVLIRAHIIPKGIARLVRGDGRNTRLTNTSVGVSKRQLGEVDFNILCGKCDGWLGRFDDYGQEICERFERDRINVGNDVFALSNFDGDRFAKFVLAILWRASISKEKAFKGIRLGPYEAKACEVLFDKRPLSALPEFQVVVGRFKSAAMDPNINFYPFRDNFDGTNAYKIGLAGFAILAKLTNKKFPADFSRYVANGATVLRGFYLNFETTSIYRAMAKMIAQHDQRTESRAARTP